MGALNTLGGIMMGLSQGRVQYEDQQRKEEQGRQETLLKFLPALLERLPAERQTEGFNLLMGLASGKMDSKKIGQLLPGLLADVERTTTQTAKMPPISLEGMGALPATAAGGPQPNPNMPEFPSVVGNFPPAPNISLPQAPITASISEQVPVFKAAQQDQSKAEAQALKDRYRAQYETQAEFAPPPKPTDLPAGWDEYLLAKSQGFTGSYLDWLSAKASAQRAATASDATPYGTSELGLLMAAKEKEKGKPLTVAEIESLRKGIEQKPQVYSAYQYIEGYKPDGTPIIKYGAPGDVIGKEPPKTIFAPGGETSLGAAQGYSTTAPPAVPEGTQISLAGWTQAIGLLDEIMPQLEAGKAGLGPLAGRVKLAEINRLGGMGATTQQIQLATDLRRLLMSQAFAEGGKQLTPTEKSEFIALNPALSDTFAQAIVKAQRSRKYLQDRYQIRVKFLGPRQQPQVPGAPPATPAAMPPPPVGVTNDPLGIR